MSFSQNLSDILWNSNMKGTSHLTPMITNMHALLLLHTNLKVNSGISPQGRKNLKIKLGGMQQKALDMYCQW